jgi:predicted nucleic acid-binding protein
MKELFEKLPKLDFKDKNASEYVLIDTCFFIHIFENQHEHQLKELTEKYATAMTSFNVDKFLLKEHVVDERVRENARKFLKHNPNLTIIDVPVQPGNYEDEKFFVHSIDPELLKEIPDASDAVLMATAIKTNSTVLTKDKHHLFTIKLENYVKKYDLKVYKEFKDFFKDNN